MNPLNIFLLSGRGSTFKLQGNFLTSINTTTDVNLVLITKVTSLPTYVVVPVSEAIQYL